MSRFKIVIENRIILISSTSAVCDLIDTYFFNLLKKSVSINLLKKQLRNRLLHIVATYIVEALWKSLSEVGV